MTRQVPIILLLLSLFLTPFNSQAQASPTIKIAATPYTDGITLSNLTKALLERIGYHAEIMTVSVPIMWKALETQDVDISVCAWLPITHGPYYAKCKDKVVNLGPNTDGARLGWVVPSYVDINSINELQDSHQKFHNKIIGIAPGAGLMIRSEETLKAYGINMNLVASSGAAMTAMLKKAIRKKQWIVVTGWSPHWMFGKWDLKYLKDPKKTLGEKEQIFTVTRKGFAKDFPEVNAVMSRFHWDIKDMQELMAKNEESGTSPYENAQQFLDEHPELLKKWINTTPPTK